MTLPPRDSLSEVVAQQVLAQATEDQKALLDEILSQLRLFLGQPTPENLGPNLSVVLSFAMDPNIRIACTDPVVNQLLSYELSRSGYAASRLAYEQEEPGLYVPMGATGLRQLPWVQEIMAAEQQRRRANRPTIYGMNPATGVTGPARRGRGWRPWSKRRSN